MLAEDGEYLTQVSGMFLGRFGEYEDVVKVHKYRTPKMQLEDRVYLLLERGRGVGETEA